ncbi:MAG: RloB family protein [Sphaerochaetaceae bacterium]|jgi:hypothetical protein|nr:RloB family protein [Sphaerochaetaceae bacterium]MDX9938962.1 RloB family protein [Sphaerochaetaceae bacterium]
MKRKKINENPRKTLLIVTASEAESLYFSQMRKDCRYTNMTVMWDSEAKGVEELIKTAARERTKGKFDSAWCVFGFADLGVDAMQVRQAMDLADKRKIQLAWTNPGIALWYLLHLQAPRLPIGDVRVVESTLKGVFPRFSSSASYLLDEGASLHLKLFPSKAQAVVNAGSYNSISQQRSQGLAPVNMTKLINEISDICGTADMSHNQKLIGLKNG